MENASKALLIAGGVILTMLVISVTIFAWSKFSEYFEAKQKLEDIENVAEFNSQFTNYNRDGVSGSEILSLANKVADYNTRYYNVANAANDGVYTEISLIVILNVENAKGSLSCDDKYRFFVETDETYTQSGSESFFSDMFSFGRGFEIKLGGSNNADKLVKQIRILKDDTYNSDYKLEIFNSCTNFNFTSYDEALDDKYLGSKEENLKKYYEYYQFKKGKFKSRGVTYDDTSSRVSTISFEFTGLS